MISSECALTTDGRASPADVSSEHLESFCHRWDVTEFALFGSALRDDFGPDSDVDVLVTFDKASRRSLFDLAEMSDELSALFGRPVDIVTRPAVERSKNWIRREAILSSARVVYAAA
jgi:predicted nucleotidyltransferase